MNNDVIITIFIVITVLPRFIFLFDKKKNLAEQNINALSRHGNLPRSAPRLKKRPTPTQLQSDTSAVVTWAASHDEGSTLHPCGVWAASKTPSGLTTSPTAVWGGAERGPGGMCAAQRALGRCDRLHMKAPTEIPQCLKKESKSRMLSLTATPCPRLRVPRNGTMCVAVSHRPRSLK